MEILLYTTAKKINKPPEILVVSIIATPGSLQEVVSP